jgi:hypothetical protein
MGKINEKGTTSRFRKLKMEEETDIHFDPDIKREFDEHEDYITSLVQSPTKKKKQPIGKKTTKGKKQSKKKTHVPKCPIRNSTRAANKFRMNSKAMFHPSIKTDNLVIIEDNS